MEKGNMWVNINDYQLYKLIIGISSGVKLYVELKFIPTIMQKVGGRVKLKELVVLRFYHLWGSEVICMKLY